MRCNQFCGLFCHNPNGSEKYGWMIDWERTVRKRRIGENAEAKERADCTTAAPLGMMSHQTMERLIIDDNKRFACFHSNIRKFLQLVM